MICLDCQGEGRVEYLKDCGRSASDCCGGCFQTEKCETCYGYGDVTADLGDEIGQRYEDIIKSASVNYAAHEKLIQSLENELFEHIKYERYR